MEDHASFTIHVDRSGRLVLPAAVRRRMGLERGGAAIVSVREDGALLSTPLQRVRDLQQWARKFRKPGESVVDEFLKDKKKEVGERERLD